jgi:type II secretory pathway component PulF
MFLVYDAVDSEGKRTTDTVEAVDVYEAVEALRSRGLFVTRIDKSAGAKTTPGELTVVVDSARLPLKVLALLTRQMAMLLRAGSGLVPAIAAIQRQMRKPQQAALLGQVITDLEQGVTLTEALRKHPHTFDPIYCAIIAAGEASATLTGMFERLADIVGKRRAMRNKILGAMAYPSLLIVMCVSILGALLFFVLPRFRDMFVQLGVETPAPTRILLSLGELVHGYWPLEIAMVVLVGVGGIGLFLTSQRGRQWVSNVQTALPVVGRLRSHLIQAQVLRTIGMLLQSRVGVLDSLGLARKSTRNIGFQRLFDAVEDAVTSGGNLSTAFEESGIVEPQICQAIRNGEDSGNLGGAMSYCADVLDETNAEMINVVTKLVEPLILIVMGVVVGGVAISLFLPLFDMSAAMQ